MWKSTLFLLPVCLSYWPRKCVICFALTAMISTKFEADMTIRYLIVAFLLLAGYVTSSLQNHVRKFCWRSVKAFGVAGVKFCPSRSAFVVVLTTLLLCRASVWLTADYDAEKMKIGLNPLYFRAPCWLTEASHRVFASSYRV